MYKLSDDAKKELNRTIKYLSDKGKSITRNNIKMYCDVRYLSDKDIDNADIQECYVVPYPWAKASKTRSNNCKDAFKKVVDYLVANKIALSAKNILKHQDGFGEAYMYKNEWAMAYLEQKRVETGYVHTNSKSTYSLSREEKLDAFREMIDDLVAKKIPLSTKNVMGDGTKFPLYYFHDNKEAKAYLKKKRDEVGYIPRSHYTESNPELVAFKKMIDDLVAKNVPLYNYNVKGDGTQFPITFFECNSEAKEYLEKKRTETQLASMNPKLMYPLSKEEKLEAFKKMIDDLVANNIPLTVKNVRGDGTKFSPFYYHDNEDARAYFEKKRAEINAKLRNITFTENAVEVSKESNINNENANMHTSEMSPFLVEYIKDVINTLYQEDAKTEISINAIYDAIMPTLNLPITLKDISNSTEIVEYLFLVNKKVKEDKVLKQIRDTVANMKKEQILINRFTILNRCSKFMDYSYLSEHPKAMELVESYI